MALKIQQNNNGDKSNQIVYSYSPVLTEIPLLPLGSPRHTLHKFSNILSVPIKVPGVPPVQMPEYHLPRAINYQADYGGCGFWRMIWPEFVINSYQKACIAGLTAMVLDLRFYQGIKAIKFQRQATSVQRDFIKELQKHKDSIGYKMIYEIDDVVFREDIPDYNHCKGAFASKETEDTILDIMQSMDEITVTCDFMKEYYKQKTGNQNITVIPNFAPKFWLGRYYNKSRIEELYEKHQRRPRILYAGSGTHVDSANHTGMKDDFEHVVKEIIKARKKFKFVWKGTYPIEVKPFISNGEMEFHPWSSLLDLPQSLFDLGCNAVFAPLRDNIFNKSKSNIKIVEAGAFGLPGTFQNLCTYKDAEIKFDSGTDLINQLEYITSDFDRYMQLSDSIYKFTDQLWLEDNIEIHQAVYFSKYGSKERNLMSPKLIKLNPEQKI